MILMFLLTGCSNKTQETQREQESTVMDKIAENKTEGKLSDIITSKNYGESVNYTANNFDNWKVFYNDGENVFIIAGKNIPSTYAPADIGLVLEGKYMGGEEVCWDDDTLIYSGISSIKSDVIDKYLFSWAKDYSNSENKTAKAIASLLDTSKWVNFLDSNVADSAIGTPTLDMFIESWNQVEERKFYYDKSNEYGYFIDEKANADNYDCSIFNKPEIEEGKGNDFYLINKDANYGYWLAGPCAKDDEWMLAVDKYGIDYADSFMAGNGLRPVVCLNANTVGKLVDGIWNLEK